MGNPVAVNSSGIPVKLLDDTLLPAALVAFTEQLYVTPLVKPATLKGEDAPDAVKIPS
jgi:hypothetical protein